MSDKELAGRTKELERRVNALTQGTVRDRIEKIGKLWVADDADIGDDLTVGDRATIGGNATVTGSVTTDNLLLPEKSAALATPASGYGKLYSSLKAPMWINDAGQGFGAYKDRIYLDPAAGVCTGTQTTIGFYNVWTFPYATTEKCDWIIEFHPAAQGVRLKAKSYVAATTSATGNIYHVIEARQAQNGTTLTSPVFLSAAATSAAAGTNVLIESDHDLGTLQSWTSGIIGIRYYRSGAAPEDTYGAVSALLGVMVYLTFV